VKVKLSESVKAFHKAGSVLAILTFIVNIDARAAAINTGVEQLLWPAVIVASPFVIVHDLLFGSDSNAQQSAEKEANKILDAFKEQIPVGGLYTGPVNLRGALYGMLVESRLPFIEVDTAGSAWLLSDVKSPQPLILQAQQHKYIRLALGNQGDGDCVAFGFANDWINAPPVRPGTCVLAAFENELQSDLHLRLDTSEVSKRKLRWEVVDRATGKVRLSIPFWESQTSGKPLRVSATYRAAHETYPFVRVLRKLSPAFVPKGSTGRSFVMNKFEEPAWAGSNSAVDVKGEFRLPIVDWGAIQGPKNEYWKEGYERAFASGKPVIINNFLLIIPQNDTVGRACANPGGNRCEFANNSVSDIGVLTATYDKAYSEPEAFRSHDRAPLIHDMSIYITARSFSGSALWHVRISPASLPSSHQVCRNFSLGCYFYPEQATTTASELVVLGKFSSDGDAVGNLPLNEYELVVPLVELPADTVGNLSH
jgi:hypothetical protein